MDRVAGSEHGRAHHRLAPGVLGLAVSMVLALALASDAPAGLSGSTTYKFTDKKPIPDRGKVVVELNYNSLAPTAVVADANAFFRISHPRTHDLVLKVKSPDGTAVILSRRDTRGRNLGSGRCKKEPQASNDFPDFTKFNDEGVMPIEDGTSPYDEFLGYSPNQPLSALDGLPAKGRWRLIVKDLRDGKAGALRCVRMVIGTA
jgi:subtilisin-like proprotein convertase family protein